MSPSSESNPSRELHRVEKRIILVLILLGLFVRVLPLDRLAVEHFDEGVYASNLLFPDQGYAYPARHLYAPPLVPNLIEWSVIVCGSNRVVPMLPGILLGTGSIPLIWWLSRRWFGPAAGIAAATLLAFSDYHIGLSRSALTDAPLLFFVLLAVGCMHVGLSQQRLGYCALGGVATGLAWATKYNGWLPLAIGVSGTAAAWLMSRRLTGLTKSTSIKDLLVGWFVIVTLAGALWLPVLTSLQSQGGYAAVAANHRQYLTGWSGWIDSVQRHIAVQKHWGGCLSLCGVLLAPVLAALVIRAERFTGNVEARSGTEADSENSVDRFTWNAAADDASSEDQLKISWSVVLLVSAVTSATILNPVVVMLVWPLTDWVARWMEGRRAKSVSWTQWLGLWMSIAWLIGLAFATPHYRPYPRLLLPFCCVGWIGIGSAIVRLLTGTLARRCLTSGAKRRRITQVVATVILLLTFSHAFQAGVPSIAGRQQLADIAQRILLSVRQQTAETKDVDGIKQIIYVYAEPALLHHLSADDSLLGPVTDLQFATPQREKHPVPVFVVAGPHAFASATFDRQFKEVRQQLQPVESFRYQPSDFVLLDDVAPKELVPHRQQRVQVFRVVK